MKKESLENIIQKILASHPNLTREEVINMIDGKVDEAKGFLTQESAARAVAIELGVEPSNFMFKRRVSVSDLVSGLSDVTIVGRVIFVSSMQSFTRSDGQQGRLRRVFIADKTGELKVLLWDDKVEMPENGSLIGKLMRFSHGYIRVGYDGKLELNIGSRGSIGIAPSDVNEDDFLLLKSYTKSIADIKEEGIVNTLGVVKQIFPVSTFDREDGSKGQVKRLELKDDSGGITVVLWNSKVEELAEIEVGCFLQLYKAKVRQSMSGGVELHVDSSVGTAILAEKPAGYEYLSTNTLDKCRGEVASKIRNNKCVESS
jgi:replication factor A1